MNAEEFSLYLSALLHDVGKIINRFGEAEKHEVLGGDFIRELPNLPKSIKDLTLTLVKYHHERPENIQYLNEDEKRLIYILKKADVTSASHEREPRDVGSFPEKRLTKIFTQLEGENAQIGSGEFPLMEIQSLNNVSVTNDVFSFKDSGYKDLTKDLKKLLSLIEVKVENDTVSNADSVFDAIDNILWNYTAFIPSAFFYSKPLIPLYHHSRLTAAISLCINKSVEQDRFIFVKGELSGIQRYLFSYLHSEGSDKGATKRFRGRSFFVRLATDAVVSYILRTFNIFRFNVVWQKTDGFLIILDYSEENIEKLETIRLEIEKSFERMNRGLRCFLSWRDARLGDLKDISNKNFSKHMEFLAEEINIRKRRVLAESFDEALLAPEIRGKLCETCGKAFYERHDKCKYCEYEEVLGSVIPKRNVILSVHNPVDLKENEDVYFRFGSFSVLYDPTFMKEGDRLQTISINNFRVNGSEVEEYPGAIPIKDAPGKEYFMTRTFIQGNYVPKKKGEVSTFDDLLCPDKDTRNSERCLYLGLLKADVDNLGRIMIGGLSSREGKGLVLHKMAAVSDFLTQFFSLVVNKIAKQHGVYVVYSGGDDLTALGPANRIIEFSKSLRNLFRKWTSTDNLTLSAGIEVVHHRFPVRRAVDLAEEELLLAKKNVGNGHVKNSLGIYDLAIKWEDVEHLSEIEEQLYEKMRPSEKDGSKRDHGAVIGRSFPYILLKLDEWNPYVKTDEIRKGSVLKSPDYYLYYYLRRNVRKEYREEILRNIFSNITDPGVFRNIRFIANNITIRMRGERYGL